MEERKKIAAVLVMGDIGRSPRISNHALELASTMGYEVYLIGQAENKNYENISNNPNIRIANVPHKWVKLAQKLPTVIYFVIRCVIQTLLLLKVFLLDIKKPDILVVQNPPALPVLSFIYLYKFINPGMKVLLDIHNFGFTLMFRTKNSLIMKFVTWYERFFARKIADEAIVVSQGMAQEVHNNWGLKIPTVVYDKPNTQVFRELTKLEKYKFFSKFDEFSSGEKDQNKVMKMDQDSLIPQAVYCEGRPIVLVTSTSYTYDEKIEQIFDAMVQYDSHGQSNPDLSLRKLILVVTGSGPRKQFFKKFIKENSKYWKLIEIHMIWFEADDYPKILACADVGVCLHYSSSGLDTPMKIIDMFGASLPCLAAKYPCIGEVVVEGENGFLFDGTQELYQKILSIGSDWENMEPVYEKLRNNIRVTREYSWSQEWDCKVKPIIKQFEEDRYLEKKKIN